VSTRRLSCPRHATSTAAVVLSSPAISPCLLCCSSCLTLSARSCAHRLSIGSPVCPPIRGGYSGEYVCSVCYHLFRNFDCRDGC
jgi:hypothetical protein